jgi:hypothetical protein
MDGESELEDQLGVLKNRAQFYDGQVLCTLVLGCVRGKALLGVADKAARASTAWLWRSDRFEI